MNKELGIKNGRAKKSLGQNFLKNKSVVKDIVLASDLKKEDVVLEIGPGKGILTEELLKKGGQVIAIEKDDELFEKLREKFAEEISKGKLNLIHGDVLIEDFSELKNYKLIANIPYNITGEILRKFLSSKNQPNSITLLVQKEVAERIVAKNKKPFDSAQGKESILSISVKVFGTPKIFRKVRAENFNPKPKVDSAILVIENISREFFKDIDEKRFFDLVKAGFASKRKLLKNNLRKFFGEKTDSVFEKAGINPQIRAERLSPEDWKRFLD